MSTSFDNFVNTQVKMQAAPIDYTVIRREWLQDLSALYDRLKSYIFKYTEAKQICVSPYEISISEQFLGSYEAPALHIGFQGNEQAQVRIFPEGLYLIAAKGGVTIDGPRGSAMLVRVPENSKGPQFTGSVTSSYSPPPPSEPEAADLVYAWKFFVREPRIQYVPLTETSFQELLMNIVSGN